MFIVYSWITFQLDSFQWGFPTDISSRVTHRLFVPHLGPDVRTQTTEPGQGRPWCWAARWCPAVVGIAPNQSLDIIRPWLPIQSHANWVSPHLRNHQIRMVNPHLTTVVGSFTDVHCSYGPNMWVPSAMFAPQPSSSWNPPILIWKGTCSSRWGWETHGEWSLLRTQVDYSRVVQMLLGV